MEEGEEIVVDESELTMDEFEAEEAEPEEAEDEDEGGFLDLDAVGFGTFSSNFGAASGPAAIEEPKKEILQSETNANDWKLEVERVMPSLKLTIRADAKDWRTHLEQMQEYRNSIAETFTQTQTQLDRLGQEIGKGIDKLSSREKYLNQQLEGILSQFRLAQDR